MKHNLETLKKCIDTANELGCVLKWIEGFEKELQEKQKDWRPAYISIKEILGE